MKKIGIFLSILLACILAVTIATKIQTSPEKVLDILAHWSIVWLKGLAIAAALIVAIFQINKRFESQRTMSLVGMLTFTPGLPLMLTICFGYNEALAGIGVLLGAIIGYYSYIIDDHLEDIWEIRHVVIPIAVGIGFSTSVALATWLENWQDEYIAVSDHAVSTKVTLKRYTAHYHKTKHGGYFTYSYDTYANKYFFDRGETYPNPKEGEDYVLGTGAFGRTDKAEFTHYKWIGGEKLTKKGETKGFKWIFLTENNFVYHTNITYEVEENYFGHAIQDGKEKDIPYTHGRTEEQSLPTSKDVPDSGVGMFFDFFKIMAHNPDFEILRWILLFMFAPMVLMALFVPEMRIPVTIYIASSTIIFLIILAAFAAYAGESVRDYTSSRFRGFGGGSFGGGGAGGSWDD